MRFSSVAIAWCPGAGATHSWLAWPQMPCVQQYFHQFPGLAACLNMLFWPPNLICCWFAFVGRHWNPLCAVCGVCPWIWVFTGNPGGRCIVCIVGCMFCTGWGFWKFWGNRLLFPLRCDPSTSAPLISVCLTLVLIPLEPILVLKCIVVILMQLNLCNFVLQSLYNIE